MQRKSKFAASLALNAKGRGVSNLKSFLADFNSAIRFHCERIPLGFASLRYGSGGDNGNGGNNDNSGVREDGCGVVEDDALEKKDVAADNPKKVLILMSDTGGGHRASAEAIKAAFYEEYGDQYQVGIYVFNWPVYVAEEVVENERMILLNGALGH